jgi:hypothetical protein
MPANRGGCLARAESPAAISSWSWCVSSTT